MLGSLWRSDDGAPHQRSKRSEVQREPHQAVGHCGLVRIGGNPPNDQGPPVGPGAYRSQATKVDSSRYQNTIYNCVATNPIPFDGPVPSPASSRKSRKFQYEKSLYRLDLPPIHQVQAQRNVEQAIAAYLQIQSNSNTQWKVQAEAPKEHAQALYQRRTIQGVAGGASPWVGKQTFRLLLVTSKGEEEIEVQADVSIPPMVVVAVGPLRPGQRVVEKDLQYMPLPANSKTSLEDSYTDLRDVVGKELRRSMATHQVISRQDLGAPRVINANELIEVEVVSGSIVIQTGGRSLEPGGIGDAIQIEVLPQKKKLIAQVVGERKVQVSSNAVR